MNKIGRDIVGICLVLVILTTTITLLVSQFLFNQHHAAARVAQVEYTRLNLLSYLDTREQSLRIAAEVLVRDFGFREALATDDELTIGSMLENHAHRIDADLMLVSDFNQNVVASNLNPSTHKALVEEIGNPVSKLKTTQFITFDNRLFSAFVLPVNAPVTIGYVIFAFELSPAILQHIKEKTAARLVIYHQPDSLFSMAPHLSHVQLDDIAEHFSIPAERMAHINSFNTDTATFHIFSIADISLLEQLFDKLQVTLITVSIFSGLLALLVAHFFSRRLANPLNQTLQELIYASSHDPLMGILNRHTAISNIENEMVRATRESSPYCVALVDIDNFKNINDSFGHLAGDVVLKSHAEWMRRSLRDYDVLGRFGGEEFIIGIRGTRQEITVVLNRMKNSVINRNKYINDPIVITTSIGGCITEKSQIDVNQLIAIADENLYKAKAAGKDQIVLSHS